MAGQISLEEEIKTFLDSKDVEYIEYTLSRTMPDFMVGKRARFFLEAKEKRNQYKPTSWPSNIPQPDMFILDELTVRKLLKYYPKSGIIVRDSTTGLYHFSGILSLITMPRIRTNRMVLSKYLKGKWIVRLSHMQKSTHLPGAMRHMKKYLSSCEKDAISSPCYGEFEGEEIGFGGENRKIEYMTEDFEETR